MRCSKWRTYPIVSAMLVAVNVVIFLLCTFIGNGLYEAGRLTVHGVLRNGEYGRLLWAMFLHGDAAHIFNNMLLVFFLGGMIEKEVGHVVYAMFYFVSGLGGNILSLIWKVWSGSLAGTIGASGAVFGLDGVLLALVLFSGKHMETVSVPRLLLVIAYSLYSGFTGSNIDNAAHVGGLVVGFGLGCIYCMMIRYKWRKDREV